MKKNKSFLAVVFILSLILNYSFFAFFLIKNKGYFVCHDSNEYNSVAIQISRGNGISDSVGNPTFFRVPGYSIFLASIYKIFGQNAKIALLFQIFLASLIPILVFYLSLVFFPTNFLLAKLSSIFTVFSLGLILHSGLLMSEILFLLFFLIFCILFFSSFDLFFCKQSFIFNSSKIFFSGIVLGVLSLIRPVGHPILFVLIILLLFSKFVFLQKIKSVSLIFLGWLSVVSFWIIRNYLLIGLIFFHTMTGIHFLQYFAAEVVSHAQKCSYAQSRTILLEEYNQDILKKEKQIKHKLNDIQKCYLAQKIAVKYLKANLFVTIKHAIINVFKTCFSLNSAYILFLDSKTLPKYDHKTTIWDKIKRFLFPKVSNRFLLFFIYLEIILLALMLLGFIGFVLISFFDLKRFCICCKILPLLGLMLLLTFGSGVARLRLPIEAFMIILSLNFWISFFRTTILPYFCYSFEMNAIR
ncbi:hypothetical protein ACFLYH_01975 [Candidatus Dependentiae bacterium]